MIDVSLLISPEGTPVFPGDPAPQIKAVSSLPKDICNLSELQLSAHCGTHIDAPLHFIEGGASVDKISTELLIGSCFVVEVAEQLNSIDDVFVKKMLKRFGHKGIKRVLFKTRNSKIWESDSPHIFRKDYVYLDSAGAAALVEGGVMVVGIDYLSIASFDSPEEVHKILLGAGLVIIEGLNLSKAEEGFFKLLCLPLLLQGAEGAPARVVLQELEEAA